MHMHVPSPRISPKLQKASGIIFGSHFIDRGAETQKLSIFSFQLTETEVGEYWYSFIFHKLTLTPKKTSHKFRTKAKLANKRNHNTM